MDTIIYLYHSREKTEFITEKWQEDDYCLIRLGVPALLWKNMKREENFCLKELKEPDETPHEPLQHMWERIKNFFTKPNKSKIDMQVTGNPQDSEEEKNFAELLEELRELQTVLSLLGDNPHWTYCSYEDFLKEKIYTERLYEYWNIPEFENYHGEMWVRKLLSYTVPGHYMILGYADCLPGILCEYAGKMRSIKWFLKSEQYTTDLEDFIEKFYEEYGLAVELHLVEENWIRMRPTSVVPVNILDFTGEEKISAFDVADGSIWLDMDSMDGKNRRMEARNPGVRYFSVKKQWKQRQKEGIYLDTINKNGYNTIVK